MIASALVFGSIGADTVAASQGLAPQHSTAKNRPPLEPAGPAGIQQAQGIADVDVWFISGLIVASIVAALLLADDDDDSADSTDDTD
jgi:hypothetical protein